MLSLADIVRGVLPGLQLDPSGRPKHPVRFVALVADGSDVDAVLKAVATPRTSVLVGVSVGPVPERLESVAAEFDCTLVEGGRIDGATRHLIGVTDLAAATAAIARTVGCAPRACVALVGLLRCSEVFDVMSGLVAESVTYSMLLAGPEFASWRSASTASPASPDEHRVELQRVGAQLAITLDRPMRHNAYDRHLRDALVEAFDLVLADPSIAEVTLRGRGASFCSGGDLAEFGSAPDPATAHLVRLDRSVGARVYQCRDRVTVHLHGACIGAGIEVPAFAGRIVAEPSTFFQLPELAMGLIPGAGGTVSLTKRIGRWRTAYLALTGQRLDVDTALEWGLVDGRG
jgi:hypothetical protein